MPFFALNVRPSAPRTGQFHRPSFGSGPVGAGRDGDRRTVLVFLGVGFLTVLSGAVVFFRTVFLGGRDTGLEAVGALATTGGDTGS